MKSSASGCSVALRKLFRAALTPLVTGLVCMLVCMAAAGAAHANGRLPGATSLAIDPSDDQQLLLGLTYGLALSRDGGASWSWICEQQIEGNGGNVDPAVVVTGDGTVVVLSLTNGGVLVSRDNGCSFERPTGAMQRNRGVDLTLDPSQPGRVLALMSTISAVDDAGEPHYHNLLAHSLDHGSNWDTLAELPDDMLPETVEVAASDPNRIYVSGTAASDPLAGIVERSDDGGTRWKRTTVQLPRGSGSMFISAIHPKDPDSLWVRIPGRGDVYGVLPARLWLSTDGGASFAQRGDTQGGMLGLALSPDGDRIAFGGPLDGLFVAPSDGSAAPSKVSDMPVSCLRWRSNGLYACALEPDAPFSLGFAAEPSEGFAPLWHRANTCRGSCGPPSRLEMRCEAAWQQLAPLIGADTPVCNASSSLSDGGMDAGAHVGGPSLDAGGARAVDASPVTPKPAAARTHSASGCAVMYPGADRPWWPTALLMLAGLMRRPRSFQRRARS